MQKPSLFGSPSFSSFPGVSSALHIYFYSSLYSDVVLKLDLVCECVEVEQSEKVFYYYFKDAWKKGGKKSRKEVRIEWGWNKKTIMRTPPVGKANARARKLLERLKLWKNHTLKEKIRGGEKGERTKVERWLKEKREGMEMFLINSSEAVKEADLGPMVFWGTKRQTIQRGGKKLILSDGQQDRWTHRIALLQTHSALFCSHEVKWKYFYTRFKFLSTEHVSI